MLMLNSKVTNMNAQKILLPAFAATSVMTAFSYLIAELEKKNFSESELLAKIEKKQLRLPKQLALPAGWATHYAVGIVMTLLFEFYKKYFNKKPAFYHTIIYGTLGGFVAIAAWKILFTMLQQRSADFYRKFYIQLFLVHLIFAGTITISQKAIRKF